MRTIILSLITAGLLLTGCAGGGSSGGSSSAEALSNTTGDGNGDGDGNNGGGDHHGMNNMSLDGGGGGPSLPAEVELSISPFVGGLRIRWHNLSAVEQGGGIYIHLNLTSNDDPPEIISRRIAVEDFTNDNYEIDGLANGTAYRLVEVAIELADNISRAIDNIVWSEPWETKTNELDNNGNGIVVGANHDGDGRADGVDEDDDNDGRPNSMDHCRLGETGWSSTNSTLDYDSDGCRDRDEDWDNDNDGVNNTRADGTQWDLCRQGDLGWTSNETSDHDGDGCQDNGTANGGYGEDEDDDNDGVADSMDTCPVGRSGWSNDGTNDFDGDGCHNDEELDDDGDGLIEIGTAEELDAVRWVLNGTGFKQTDEAVLNQTGCGDGLNISRCSGYELIRNISLTDYIAERYPKVGWQPIAHDVDTMDTGCQGELFTGTFDGNGFEVSGLFINRSAEDCIGLFGQADGIIRRLGVRADRVIGRIGVGGLVGLGNSAEVIQSYAVSGAVGGDLGVGGLVGSGNGAKIVQSYVISDQVRGSANDIGGLVGSGNGVEIIRSYAVSGTITGGTNRHLNSRVGGLVGDSSGAKIIQSYMVSGEVRGDANWVGGLLGFGAPFAEIIQSYAVSSEVRGNLIGGLVGGATNNEIIYSYGVSGVVRGGILGGLAGNGGSARDSYWDRNTSGRTNDGATGSSEQTTIALRSPTDYTDIYATWDDGAISEGTTIAGVDHNGTIWCDEDASGVIEDNERRGAGDTDGDNRVWDFGSTTDYPAIRCTPDSLADQRAWWFLNATHKPQLNQTRLDAWLHGTLP